jgi:hypothetical protein
VGAALTFASKFASRSIPTALTYLGVPGDKRISKEYASRSGGYQMYGTSLPDIAGNGGIEISAPVVIPSSPFAVALGCTVSLATQNLGTNAVKDTCRDSTFTEATRGLGAGVYSPRVGAKQLAKPEAKGPMNRQNSALDFVPTGRQARNNKSSFHGDAGGPVSRWLLGHMHHGHTN